MWAKSTTTVRSGLVRGARLVVRDSGWGRNQYAGSFRHGFLLVQSGDCFCVLDSGTYHLDGGLYWQAFGFGGLDGGCIFRVGRCLLLDRRSRGEVCSFMKHLTPSARWAGRPQAIRRLVLRAEAEEVSRALFPKCGNFRCCAAAWFKRRERFRIGASRVRIPS